MSSNSTPEVGTPTSTPSTSRWYRSRSRQVIAGTAAAALAVTGLAVTGGSGAAAAAPPNSQSAGNFVDATVGHSPLDPILKLAFARAQNPGNVTDQNPLDVTVLNAINLPLTGALQFPSLLGIHLGAVNQVAVAKSDGYSYGASGAVLNSGGVSVGGNNNAFPANATIDLSAAGISGNSPLAVPGGTGSADLLGGVQLSIGAVSALARTPAGTGPGSTTYQIADVTITAKSPLIGKVLDAIGTTAGGILTKLSNSGAQLGLSLPASCPLTSGKLPALPPLLGGALVISNDGSLTFSLDKLLKSLKLDLNHLPANTDLIDYLLNYLSSPSGLAAGLSDTIGGLANSLATGFASCTPPALANVLNPLIAAGSKLQKQINDVIAELSKAGGQNPLAPLGGLVKKLVDIGVNVQPNGPAGTFVSQLGDLPKQGMDPPPVPYQYVVRAIEVNLLGGGVNVALANAAAGPSHPAVVTPPTSSPPTTPNTNIPTGVPAGFDKQPGTPEAPLVLLVIGLMMASGGAIAWKVRGKHST